MLYGTLPTELRRQVSWLTCIHVCLDDAMVRYTSSTMLFRYSVLPIVFVGMLKTCLHTYAYIAYLYSYSHWPIGEVCEYNRGWSGHWDTGTLPPAQGMYKYTCFVYTCVGTRAMLSILRAGVTPLVVVDRSHTLLGKCGTLVCTCWVPSCFDTYMYAHIRCL